MDLDSTPMTLTERAQMAGVCSAYSVMLAASRLDANLPTIYLIRLSGGLSGTSRWMVAHFDGRESQCRKLYTIAHRSQEPAVLAEAKRYVAERYGITKMGKVPGTGRTYYPAAVAATVKAAIKTRSREQMLDLMS